MRGGGWLLLPSPGPVGGQRRCRLGDWSPRPPRWLMVVAGGRGDCAGAKGNGWRSQHHVTRGWGPTPGTPLLASAGLSGGAGVRADASCHPPWERACVSVDLGCLLGSDGETEAHGAERLCPVTGQAGWLLATPGSDPGLCAPSLELVCILAVWVAGHCACARSGPVRACGPRVAVSPSSEAGPLCPCRHYLGVPGSLLEWGLSPAQASGRTLHTGQSKVAMRRGL